MITVSQHTKLDLLRVLDFPEERIHVVYNGIDASFVPITDARRIEPVLRKYSLPTAGYILHVGTLEPRKNLPRLIAAYAQLRRQLGQDTPPLVLAGARGWQYEEIFRAIEQFGVKSPRVFYRFCG